MWHEGGNDVKGSLVEQRMVQRRQVQFVILKRDQDRVGYYQVNSLVGFLIAVYAQVTW
jgi:hypothetical protein